VAPAQGDKRIFVPKNCGEGVKAFNKKIPGFGFTFFDEKFRTKVFFSAIA